MTAANLPEAPKVPELRLPTFEELEQGLKKAVSSERLQKLRDLKRATEQTTGGYLERLKSELAAPEKEKLASMFDSSAVAEKLGLSSVKSGVEKLGKTASEAMELAKKGDFSGAVNAVFAPAAAPAAGASAEAGIGGAFKSFSDKIGQFFDAIKLWLAASFPGIASFLGIKAPDAAELAKDGIQKAKEAASSVLDEKTIKDYEERLMNELRSTADKKEAFGRVFEKYKDRLKKPVGDAENFNPHLINDPLTLGSASADFAIDLAREGVIPWDNILADMYDTASDYVWIGVRQAASFTTGIATEGARYVLGHVSAEMLHKKIEELNTDERAFLMGMIYRKGGLVFRAMGVAANVVGNLAMMLPTWSERQTVSGAASAFDAAMGDYERIAARTEDLTMRLGLPKNESCAKMRAVIQEYRTNLLVAQAYADVGDDAAKFSARIAQLKGMTYVDPVILDNVSKISFSEEKSFGKAIAGVMRSGKNLSETGGMSLQKRMGYVVNYPLGAYGQADVSAARIGARAFECNRALADTTESGRGVLRKIKSLLWDSRLQMSFFKEFEGGILQLTRDQADQFAANMKNAIKEAPGAVAAFFEHMPIIAVIGLNEGKDARDYLANLGKSLCYMVPFVGPIHLLRGDGLKYQNVMKDPSTAILGMTMLTVDAFGVVSAAGEAYAVGRFAPLAEFAARPVYDMARLAGGTARLGANSAYTVKTALQAWEMGGSAELVALGRNFGLAGLALVAVGSFAYDWTSVKMDEKNYENAVNDLIAKKVLNADGTPNGSKLADELKVMPIDKKERFLAAAVSMMTGTDGTAVKVDGTSCKVNFSAVPDMKAKEGIRGLLGDLGLSSEFFCPEGLLEESKKSVAELGEKAAGFLHQDVTPVKS